MKLIISLRHIHTGTILSQMQDRILFPSKIIPKISIRFIRRIEIIGIVLKEEHITEFQKTDLDICCRFKLGERPSFSRINTVKASETVCVLLYIKRFLNILKIGTLKMVIAVVIKIEQSVLQCFIRLQLFIRPQGFLCPHDADGMANSIVQLQKRGVIEDNSKIIFLFLNENICCDPSLEPSLQDGSNEGHNTCI